MTSGPAIVVIGSVNLDLVASVSRLPVAGETISGAELHRFPGGKGANQALAASRLGADVTLIARVGEDAYAQEALALLVEGGVDLSGCQRTTESPTGIALICVAADGENQIVVAPGANHTLGVEHLQLPAADALICQLEVPVSVLCAAAREFNGLLCINLAPAREVPDELLRRADVIVVNETEAAYYGDVLQLADTLVVTTLGKDGAVAVMNGEVVARAGSPRVDAIDTVGAGDSFTAALTVQLARQQDTRQALEFACAAGALAATRQGAQPSLPAQQEVEAILSR